MAGKYPSCGCHQVYCEKHTPVYGVESGSLSSAEEAAIVDKVIAEVVRRMQANLGKWAS